MGFWNRNPFSEKKGVELPQAGDLRIEELNSGEYRLSEYTALGGYGLRYWQGMGTYDTLEEAQAIRDDLAKTTAEQRSAEALRIWNNTVKRIVE